MDYSNIENDEDMYTVLRSGVKAILESQEPVRHLSDFTNSYLSSAFFEEMKRCGQKFGHLSIKRAAYGLSGVKRVLANAYYKMQATPSRVFKNKKQAIMYLLEEI